MIKVARAEQHDGRFSSPCWMSSHRPGRGRLDRLQRRPEKLHADDLLEVRCLKEFVSGLSEHVSGSVDNGARERYL
jgi:hypothetical protein